jgi:hypothetical protein
MSSPLNRISPPSDWTLVVPDRDPSDDGVWEFRYDKELFEREYADKHNSIERFARATWCLNSVFYGEVYTCKEDGKNYCGVYLDTTIPKRHFKLFDTVREAREFVNDWIALKDIQ